MNHAPPINTATRPAATNSHAPSKAPAGLTDIGFTAVVATAVASGADGDGAGATPNQLPLTDSCVCAGPMVVAGSCGAYFLTSTSANCTVALAVPINAT